MSGKGSTPEQWDRAKPLLDTVHSMSEEIVEFLRALVRIPSVTGEEAEVGRFVEKTLRKMGLPVELLEAERGRPNVLATWDSGASGPTLLLNDHLDIIPPGPLEFWTHPPFAADIADGRVYGRGTIDTKSGLTTLIMATEALRRSGIAFRGKLSLACVCDEEVGGKLGIQHIAKLGRLRADMAVVAEPTTMQIEIATKGRMNIRVATRGVATHGARPWFGHNAIDDMAHVITELGWLYEKLKQRRHPLLGHPTLNVGLVQGGTVPNMVPNKCIIEIDRRLIPGETQEQAMAEIREVLARVKSSRPSFDASAEQLLWWPGYAIEETEPIVQIACRAYEKVVGVRPRVAGKDAGTDASWINTLAGIPVVMFSPGDGMKAMNADENVGIDDLITATKVIAQIIHDVLVLEDPPT